MAKKQLVNSYTEVLDALSKRIGKTITPHDLFEIGMGHVKRIEDTQIHNGWKALVDNVCNPNSNAEVSVRSHGRNASGSDELLSVLEAVFDREFIIDKTNNQGPSSILKKAFDEEYQDYQISHVFEERTNNPLLFTAPWMICYTPKIIDPFTGHETKGFPEFREEFIDWAFSVNKEYIDDYNEIIRPYWRKLKSVLNANGYEEKFQKHMIATLAPILRDAEKLSKTDRIQYYLDRFAKI